MNIDIMLIYEIIWIGTGMCLIGYAVYGWIRRRRNGGSNRKQKASEL